MFEWSGASPSAPIKYAFVSIGALLVGAIRLTGASVGSEYKRGDEMGYFAYGVSLSARNAVRYVFCALRLLMSYSFPRDRAPQSLPSFHQK